MPLVDIFREIRKSLTNEINIVAEQKNFIRAREYYKGSKKAIVPEIRSSSLNRDVAALMLWKSCFSD